MRRIVILLLIFVVMTMLSCTSSQDKAFNAQAEVSNERLKLVETYQKCIAEAGDDSMKAEACEQYIKAADALK